MAGTRTSLPLPLLARLERQFGARALEEMIRAFTATRRPSLRVNTLRAQDVDVMNRLREDGITFERPQGIPHAFFINNQSDDELLEHPLAKEGKIYLQGLTSMLPPLLLGPQPGEHILDICAAPGSKTSQMGAMMENQGAIVAVEESVIRVQKLRHTVETQGISIANVLCADATKLAKLLADNPSLPQSFDRILADVPCTAEGRISLRDKRSYGFWSEKNIIEHAKLQRKLLRAAVPFLKPGGTIVYSTCTLAPEENEEMVSWLLQEFPDLRLEKISVPVQHARTMAHGTVILPTKNHEGFFVAKLSKK